ncbi:MAG: TonB-dependent receptor domain-containing protein, partial [Lysobacterales bacterium]
VRVNEKGNLNLVPEASTNYNVGAIWSPTDSFDMRLDYWRFEYEDVITVENAQGKIQDDLNGDDIIRVAGDNSQLAGVNVDYINAAKVDTHGLDLNAYYTFSTDTIGDFGVQLSATHFLSYEIPTAAGGVRDVVGFFNHDNFARSIPETKANLSFDWTMGSHSATVSAFYVDSYATTRTVPPGSSQQIDDWTTVDLQYAYNLDLSASQVVLTLGVKNAFDAEPPVVYDAANLSYDPKHHDPRGRMYYMKVKYGF